MSELLTRKDEYYSQTIIGAVQRNRAELLRQLLIKKPNYGLDDLAKALNIAAEKGFDNCVDVLLSHGAMPDIHNLTGLTPLILAARNGHSWVIKSLINAGCKINKPSFGIRATALHWASTNNHLECVQALLEAKANTEVETVHRHTPLMLAARAGFADIVEELINANCSLDTSDYSKMTAMHLSAEEGAEDCVRLLLEAGATVDQPNKYGETPILLAAKNGHTAVFQMLLKVSPVSPTWRCRQMTLLHWVAYGGSVECIQSLVDLHFDVNAKSSEDYVSGDFFVCKDVTPLMLAAQRGHADAVSMLLSHDADVECVDTDGMTALLHAIKHDKATCVQVLLQHGVDPDGSTSVLPHFIDNELFPPPGLPLTPLMYAIKENSVESAKALIQANCSMELLYSYSPDETNVTPFEFALYRRRLQICKLMLACGLRPSMANVAVMQEGFAWVAQEYEAFFADMLQLLLSPPRLCDIARQAIRRCLGSRLLHTLPELPLPSALKEFVALADIVIE